MNPVFSSDSGPSRGSAYFTFTLLFLLYMFDYMDRMIVVSLFPFLQKDWGLTDAQCGLLVSAVYWSILIFTLPVSVLIDRWSRKKSIAIMSLIWGAATLVCAFVRTFPQMFAARTAIGVGEAGYAPGGGAMISAIFPPEKRARILGIWNASIPLGSALGIALGGFIAVHYGWRHAFGIVAAPGMLIAVLFFLVRDYQTVELVETVRSQGDTERVPLGFRDVVRQFARNRTLLFNNLAFACNVFVTTALLTWLPTYFHRMDGIAMDKAGTKAATVMLLAVIGAPLGGWLTDRWLKRRSNARMLFPFVSSLVTSLLLFAAFVLFQGPLQYGVLLLCGVAGVGFVPAAVAVTQDVVHPGLRAVSLSLSTIIQHLLGSALGPPVIGALSDAFGLGTALAVLPLFTFTASLLFLAGSFHYVKDASRVERIEVRMESE
jgi:MFS family permease